MKKIAVISPLRGTPVQFSEIDRRVKAAIACSFDKSPEAEAALRERFLRELRAMNMALAERLCREVIEAGHRPVAGHLFYTRFLDDVVEQERELGMLAGRLDFAECAEAWVYRRAGISSGMHDDVTFVRSKNVLVYTPPSWDVA